ncbi:MAG: cell division topological specificity factor MinE [Lachnospiraceae bacterium]|nr:cell division topological specificity factor MinE [Lachnospiraceae bacterium]
MSFIDFFKRKPTSGNVAKDRLKLVLVSDRANCSPELMEQIKNDIINVLQKYLEIDLEGLDIKISQTELDDNNGAVPALFANIPIKDMKAKEEDSNNNKKNSKNKNSNNIKRTIVTNGSKDKLKV